MALARSGLVDIWNGNENENTVYFTFLSMFQFILSDLRCVCSCIYLYGHLPTLVKSPSNKIIPRSSHEGSSPEAPSKFM